MKTLITSHSPSLHGLSLMHHTTSSLHCKPRYLQTPQKFIRSATPQQFKNESMKHDVYYSSVSPHRITFCPWSLLFACAGDSLSLYLQIKGFIIMTVSQNVMLVVIYLRAMIDSSAWTLCCFSSVLVKSRV